ncbi:hypothetical protein B0H17DRAFT_1137290 [Mycena rosella]|uniref:Uncharacterized protein n=1 Tax=Mycena rosella TaxID=1033263 RepID=A0AAD7GF13_MYCRO|nr:hypothetical protein B0H17DRAFT_1137290 [Mycena rosella]
MLLWRRPLIWHIIFAPSDSDSHRRQARGPLWCPFCRRRRTLNASLLGDGDTLRCQFYAVAPSVFDVIARPSFKRLYTTHAFGVPASFISRVISSAPVVLFQRVGLEKRGDSLAEGGSPYPGSLKHLLLLDSNARHDMQPVFNLILQSGQLNHLERLSLELSTGTNEEYSSPLLATSQTLQHLELDYSVCGPRHPERTIALPNLPALTSIELKFHRYYDRIIPDVLFSTVRAVGIAAPNTEVIRIVFAVGKPAGPCRSARPPTPGDFQHLRSVECRLLCHPSNAHLHDALDADFVGFIGAMESSMPGIRARTF